MPKDKADSATKTDSYDYTKLHGHRAVQAYYVGWLGQQMRYFADVAVAEDIPEYWKQAGGDAVRLARVVQDRWKEEGVSSKDPLVAALLALLQIFSDGEWWTGPEGRRERIGSDEQDFRASEAEPGAPLEHPGLAVFEPAVAAVSGRGGIEPYQKAIDDVLTVVGSKLKQVDLLRTGAAMAGLLGRRWSADPHTSPVRATLGDLQASGAVEEKWLIELCQRLRFSLERDPDVPDMSGILPPAPPDADEAYRVASRPFTTVRMPACEQEHVALLEAGLGVVLAGAGIQDMPPVVSDLNPAREFERMSSYLGPEQIGPAGKDFITVREAVERYFAADVQDGLDKNKDFDKIRTRIHGARRYKNKKLRSKKENGNCYVHRGDVDGWILEQRRKHTDAADSAGDDDAGIPERLALAKQQKRDSMR